MCSQYASMVQCFRFLNSETFFDDKALTVLLRVLCEDDKEYREKWWTEVRACRRRKQEPLGAADIQSIFRFSPSFLQNYFFPSTIRSHHFHCDGIPYADGVRIHGIQSHCGEGSCRPGGEGNGNYYSDL